MELDSRKKSKRDRMMRLNSFDKQKVREIGRKEAGESRGFPLLRIISHLMKYRRCHQVGTKGMQSPGEIEDVKKKIHARAWKMLWHGIGNFVWASGSGGGKIGGSRKTFNGRERRAEGRVRPPQDTWLGGAQ